MNYIDLFAGCGGFSCGFQNAGYDLLYANEIDNYASMTFANNHRDNFGCKAPMINLPIERLIECLGLNVDNSEIPQDSVSTKTYSELIRRGNNLEVNQDQIRYVKNLKDVDVIIGGPPCQGFSFAGRSKGLGPKLSSDFIDDPRNILFKRFLQIVDYHQPKMMIMENVKGLLSTGSKNYFNQIKNEMSKCGSGYFVNHVVLKSSNFGVAQSRERLFVFGIREDVKDSDLLAFQLNMLFDYYQRASQKRLKETTVKEAIDDLPSLIPNPKKNNNEIEAEIDMSEKDSFGEFESIKDYNQLIRNEPKYVRWINELRGNHHSPKKLYNHKVRFNNKSDLKIYKEITAGKYLNHESNKDVLKRVAYGTFKDEQGEIKIKSFFDKYFKLDPNSPSRTITAHLSYDNNGYIHYNGERGISVREAARLQSFPDWFRFEGTLSNQFKQVGNAVPPKLAEFIANFCRVFLADGYDSVKSKIFSIK